MTLVTQTSARTAAETSPRRTLTHHKEQRAVHRRLRDASGLFVLARGTVERALSTRLQPLREEERTLIAREIHDELSQTLTGLKMDLRWAEKHLAGESNQALNPILERIVEAGELVDSTLVSVQRIASELRPRVLVDLGLSAVIQQ